MKISEKVQKWIWIFSSSKKNKWIQLNRHSDGVSGCCDAMKYFFIQTYSFQTKKKSLNIKKWITLSWFYPLWSPWPWLIKCYVSFSICILFFLKMSSHDEAKSFKYWRHFHANKDYRFCLNESYIMRRRHPQSISVNYGKFLVNF